MGWTIIRKSSGGITQGLEFSANLGDSSEVSQWANAPQPNLDYMGNIQRAYWEMGSGPSYNHWIPMGAEITVLTLMAIPYRTWVDAFEFLCDKNNNVYINSF